MTVGPASAEDLVRALDAAAQRGRVLDFWWRDDDLQEPAPALEPLLSFAARTGWAPGLAVVPEGMDADGLAARLDTTGAELLVHGFAHRNHAAQGQKKCEFPAGRSVAEMRADATAGLRALIAVFPDAALPIFVPPWNRIAPGFVAELTACGFSGLSAFTPRRNAEPAPGLKCVNTHIDVIDWRGTRRFVGIGAVREAIIRHLAVCAAGAVDPEEACGLLTHHLVMVEEDWRELGALASELATHEAVRLRAPSDCFCF
ncbi:polysaccharide deacetylase family protein [Nisaea acidiphila]|uniref:Polysaccharide deacetylase family protein n=1 Tax=Nisaea acidiphila TaxID=1862145 RepID=A0A9J7ANV3_9PROT|nr:polysaccharide deacetylase family protein [Nisaea acidiphila]UUX48012.1 polysaccharide deacetylase family protein [Nisaea acidiphila]